MTVNDVTLWFLQTGTGVGIREDECTWPIELGILKENPDSILGDIADE